MGIGIEVALAQFQEAAERLDQFNAPLHRFREERIENEIHARAARKAAHAGNNHREGRNAIRTLARFIEAVESLTEYDRGITVNVGRVEGGRTKNTVPDEATAHIDLRFETVADGEALLEAFRRAAHTCPLQDTRIELEGGIARVPLASGDLSGKYKPGAQFTASDVRSTQDRQKVDEKLREVQRIAREEVPAGVDMAKWALAWCLRHEAVTSVIPGCKDLKQVEANAAAAELVEANHPQVA